MQLKNSSVELFWRGKEDHQQILEKIILAQEIERRKWALEIHDGITQSLVNIYYRLQAYQRLLLRDPAQAQQELQEVESLVSESIAEARRLIDELRPSILDDIGLIPTIEKHLRRVGRESGLSINFQVERPIPRMSSPAETAIYRIIQEALSNIQRHAKATQVQVTMSTSDRLLTVDVADNGCGFDLEAVDAEGDNWGLIGMQERAEILGGSLQIMSTIGYGTRVHLQLPIAS